MKNLRHLSLASGIALLITAVCMLMLGLTSKENSPSLHRFLLLLGGDVVNGGYVEALMESNAIPTEYAHPFYTILSAFYDEAGDRDRAWLALTEAKKLKPDYALAHLLTKVFSVSNFDSWESMRNALHSKVKAELGA